MNVREKVLQGFRLDEWNAYSQELPFKHDNGIDDMLYLGLLAGAAKRYGDTELQVICEDNLNTLQTIGEDARCYAPYQVKPEWIRSLTIPQLWYKVKPQSFAGPAALYWAVSQGCNIRTDVAPVTFKAKLLCLTAHLFGCLIRWIPWFRQHINSVMMAHLLLNERPPESLFFLTKDNPFYAWLYKAPCKATYPTNVTAFPAKLYPGVEYEAKDKEYTPLCQLVSDYLQAEIS